MAIVSKSCILGINPIFYLYLRKYISKRLKIQIMKIERFSASEIPYDQFESLGYSKKDVLDIKKDVLENFLSGGKTDLRLFSIPVDGQTFRVEGKLSLHRNPDNSASLIIHPAQKEVQNNMGLDNKELEALKNGKLLSKNINGERTLLQLDRETNEILKQKETNVIPSAIRDIQLSSDQQERLRQGASVTINKNGESITAKVDLGSSAGLQIKDDRNTLHHIYKNNLSDTKEIEKLFSSKVDMNKFMERNNISSKNMPGSARAAFDKQQAIAFDRHNPGVVSYIRTDANRAEYIDMEKKNMPTLKR